MGEREREVQRQAGRICRHPLSGLSGLPLLTLSPDLESLGLSLLPLSGHTLLSSKAPWAASWLGPLGHSTEPTYPIQGWPTQTFESADLSLVLAPLLTLNGTSFQNPVSAACFLTMDLLLHTFLFKVSHGLWPHL